MRILIIGQTTLQWGRMEFGNIGNYYIIEPFVRELHRTFPNSKIKTTLQLSRRFCDDENIEVLPINLYYDFNSRENLVVAKKEIKLVEEFLENGYFSETTSYIDEVMNADIVIDFSGDIWGDNANFLGEDRFEVGLYKDMVSQKLGKPTFMLAGSPGPFKENKLKELAKEVFKSFTAVANREPISSKNLKEEGFDISNVSDLACPAFLFEPVKKEKIEQIFNEETIAGEIPIVGFILCGWNFLDGPFDKWPRKDEEYEVFAKAVEYINNELGAKVCLMSHSNGFPIPPSNFQLIHGRDYPIIKQLQTVIDKRGIAKNVIALDGVYDAWTTKGIISKFDMLVSGRIHAAVAGFSQNIPTVVIDYGHEPKAHKLAGFATVVGQENYVCDPSKESELINIINDCWKNKDLVKRDLEKRMFNVKELAKENFRLIKAYSNFEVGGMK